MPLQKLEFRPGLNREGTDYANEGGWYDGDKIRFRSGFPEKIGGWTRFSSNTYIGVARSLWNWIDADGANNYLGVGTSAKYYIAKGGAYYDVTPIAYTSTLNNPVTASNGSNLLTITDATYSPNAGDYVIISGATTLGGNITGTVLNQEYIVVSTPSTTTYTIAAYSSTSQAGSFTVGVSYVIQYQGTTDFTLVGAASNTVGTVFTATGAGTGTGLAGVAVLANASDTGYGGASVTIYYEYPAGLNNFTLGTGWGAGPWSPASPVALGANPFTTNSTGVVTVAHVAHGLSNGNYVAFAGAVGFAGIATTTLNSTFIISGVAANSYQITLPSSTVATSSTTGGGSAVVETPQTGTRGWGTGYSSGVAQQLRLWSNDNFGSDLVLAPRGGPIYYWQDYLGVSNRAVTLKSLASLSVVDPAYPSYTYQDYVPIATNQVVTSAIQKFVIAFGANSYVDGTPGTPYNPMLVRWSDQLNATNWVPAITNQSGEFALTNGSFIMGARSTRQEILIWTDSALYSMQYLGAPYVWGFNILMDNISVMSPNSMITVNNVTYWMGTDKFYTYSGRVETLPCSLRQYIFADLNNNQAFQVFAGSNEGYNEIWWFYVSDGSVNNTIDKYVIYNYVDRVWYYGTMARTAWLDSGIQPYPLAANYDNRILFHESAVDDVSGTTAVPINAYVQSSDFDIGDGHNFGFVWRILPDVNFNGSNVNNPSVAMTIKPRQNSGTPYGQADSPTVTSGDNFSLRSTYNIQEFTGQVYTRLRGRQMSFRIESTGLGVAWQLGMPRMDIRPDGRR